MQDGEISNAKVPAANCSSASQLLHSKFKIQHFASLKGLPAPPASGVFPPFPQGSEFLLPDITLLQGFFQQYGVGAERIKGAAGFLEGGCSFGEAVREDGQYAGHCTAGSPQGDYCLEA